MKGVARAALRRVGFEVRRIQPPAGDAEREYVLGGRVPWSRGYLQARDRFIGEILSDPGLLETFRKGGGLPDRFGVGLDERCVEYPWLLAHLEPGPERVLDAGSTLNHAFILEHPALREKKLHILTLAPEASCFWQKGVSYLYEDLRAIPIRDAHYGTVVCLSTLEHVGCDNSALRGTNSGREDDRETFVVAMKELGRVLKPGGQLFLTVPFGAYRDHGAFQQFDAVLLARAIEAFGEASEVTQRFYRYGADGWQVADAAACAHCGYVERVAAAWGSHAWPVLRPVEKDLAAAARAVACVQLVKS